MKADWKFISHVIVAEVILAVVGGYVFNTVESAKYSHMNYVKHTSWNYQISAPDAPMLYTSVLVKETPDRKSVEAVFFAPLGNMAIVDYKNGRWSISSSINLSNYVLLIPFILSLILFYPSSFLARIGIIMYSKRRRSYVLVLLATPLAAFTLLTVKFLLTMWAHRAGVLANL